MSAGAARLAKRLTKRLTHALMLGLLLSAPGAHAAPTVSLTAPGEGWTYNAPASLTLKASAAVDPADVGATLTRVEFYANDVLIGSDTRTGYTLAWSPGAGAHVLTAKAIDSLGQATVSAPRTLTITDAGSNRLPSVNFTAPANNAKYALPVEITLSANALDVEKNGGITQVEFLANDQIIGSASAKPYSLTWSNPPAGTHVLTARATDTLGGQALSVTRTLVIQGSNTPPTASLGGVTAGTYLLPVSFSLTASANGGEINTPVTRVEFLANDQVIATVTAKPYAFTWVDPSAGTYALAARATDSQGLSTTSALRSVTLASNTAPTVNLTAPANKSTYVLPADLVVSANASDLERNDGIAQVEFLANGQVIGTSASKPYRIVWSNPAPGTYTLSARATDTQGAPTESAVRTVTINDSNAPPKVSLSAPANKAVFPAPANITLTANVSGPEANTPVAQVEFLANGQVIGSVSAKPYSVVWANAPAGTHALAVRATDTLGASATSAVRTITVTAANQAPTVTLTQPDPGTVLLTPANLTLSATATDSDGTITQVEFYNGSTLIGTATSAPYTATWNAIPAGSYRLTAIATDDQGTTASSAPVAITVVTNQAPTVSLTGPANNQHFTAPATITLSATANDADNNLVKVEFYNGTTLLGMVLEAPFTYAWTAVPQGSFSLTAIATDALGVQTSSTPATITVGPKQTQLYFIQADHLGTPRLITDQNNATVWRNLPITEAFGNSPVEDDPNNTGNRFEFNLRFPGQYADKETGTNYNFFRDYDSSIGRYLQSDPIGLEGGINTYGYVGGKPISQADPTGLIAPWVIGAGVGAVANAISGGYGAFVGGGSLGEISVAAVAGGATGAVTGTTAVLSGAGLVGAFAINAAVNMQTNVLAQIAVQSNNPWPTQINLGAVVGSGLASGFGGIWGSVAGESLVSATGAALAGLPLEITINAMASAFFPNRTPYGQCRR